MEHMGVVIIGFLDFVLSVVNCEFFNIQVSVSLERKVGEIMWVCLKIVYPETQW